MLPHWLSYCPHVDISLEAVCRKEWDTHNCCFDLKSFKTKWNGIMQFFIYAFWVQRDKFSRIKFREYKDAWYPFKEILNAKHKFTVAIYDFRKALDKIIFSKKKRRLKVIQINNVREFMIQVRSLQWRIKNTKFSGNLVFFFHVCLKLTSQNKKKYSNISNETSERIQRTFKKM